MGRSVATRSRSGGRRASLVFCVISLAVGGPAERLARAQAPETAAAPASDAKKMDEARRHFQLGLNLLRDPEGEVVEGAYLEFKTAYELSKSPRVLGNIGYCAMRMERNSESVAAYREYIRLVPNIDPVERAQIDRDLLTMTDGAATLQVRYAGTTPWTLIDERVPVRVAPVTNSYGPTTEPLTLLIRPGHHVLHLKSGGEERGRWELDATGGSAISHTFELMQETPVGPLAKPERERPPPASRTPQLVTIGAGAIVLAAGAVTGIAAFAKMKDLEGRCPGNVCPNGDFRDEVSTARALGTATDTLLIGGGVLVAGGALWLALSRRSRSSDTVASPPVTGACVPGACGISFRGSF
jgi:hypothetical protein